MCCFILYIGKLNAALKYIHVAGLLCKCIKHRYREYLNYFSGSAIYTLILTKNDFVLRDGCTCVNFIVNSKMRCLACILKCFL